MRYTLFVACLTVALWSASADAQRFKKGTLSGTAVSATLPSQAPGTSTAFFTVPGPSEKESVLVITEVCVSKEDVVFIDAVNFGTLPHTGDISQRCHTFTPGVVIPGPDTIQCIVEASATSAQKCLFNGILTKPR